MTARPRPGRIAPWALAALVVPLWAAVAAWPDGAAGGAATVWLANSHAFSQPAPALDAPAAALHRDGNRIFEASFVTAPAPAFGGLGPTFNQTGCAGCHARDGRSPGALLVRVSVPGAGPHGGPAPAPGLGLQIQDRAVFGEAPEASVDVTYAERVERLADGTAVPLRVPTLSLVGARGPLPPALLTSPRAARPVFGLGLLDAVPDAALHALEAAQAAAGEVSGRVNVVWDPAERRMRAGRFGHKAGQATVLAQTAAAFRDDVGLTTALLPDDDAPEVSDADLAAVTFYVRTLAVPDRRRRGDAAVQRGEAVFASVGCGACHVPRLQTGPADVAVLSDQTIYPYTDLLLHDLGAGLADGRPEFGADGREWRTPPLWGLGLTEVVNGQPGFLHDGRARTVLEAVLWHGGEAEPARERVRQLPAADRDALLAFLRSL